VRTATLAGPPSLDFVPDYWARIERAWEHVHTLEAAIEASDFNSSDDPMILFRRQFNQAISAFEFSIAYIRPFPDRWSLLVADALQSFRSALDYMVWQLFVIDNGRFPSAKEKTQFPMAQSRKSFRAPKGQLQKMLPKLSEFSIGLIEACQPYKTWHGLKPYRSLVRLERLNNQDKHRLLRPTIMAPFGFRWAIDKDTPNFRLRQFRGLSLTGRPLQVNAHVAVLTLLGERLNDSPPEVNVKPNVVAHVCFPDGSLVSDVLRDIGTTVSAIAYQMDPTLNSAKAQRIFQRLYARPSHHKPRAGVKVFHTHAVEKATGRDVWLFSEGPWAVGEPAADSD
jgi:hypothetical protein